MRPHDSTTISLTLVLAAGMVGLPPTQARGQRPARPRAPHSTTPTAAAVLAQAGYVGTPMRGDGSYRFVSATVATTPVTLLLNSGSQFDLLLDPALPPGTQAGIHETDVSSAYWDSPSSTGIWAIVDQLTFGASPLRAVEAKMEPASVPGVRAMLGATALMSQGAVIDYSTDTLYLLTSRPTTGTTWSTVAKQPTLRAALEQAGHYHMFLALMRQAKLLRLLERRDDAATSDSIAWLGPRVRAEHISGVGGMQPNELHLQLTRTGLDRWLRRPGRYTAFIPTDAAFAHVPADTLRAWRADPVRLRALLRAHLFPGVAIDTVGMRTLVRGVARPGQSAFGFHILGPRIDVDRLANWEEGRVVARATIVQPDLQAANGVAHGIDRVLVPAPTQAPLTAALTRRGYIRIPLHRSENGGSYSVRGTLNGSLVDLTIDTGTPGEVVLDRQWADRLPAARDRQDRLILDTVRLGPVTVTLADLGRSIQWIQRQGYRASVGRLGSSFLTRHHAVLDYAAGMLYLQGVSF